MKLFFATVISLSTSLLAIAQVPVKPKASFTGRQFIEQAALNRIKVVGAANLANKKAQDKKLKAFSEMELSDHHRVNIELMTLAKSKNIVMPTSTARHQKADKRTAASPSATLSDQNTQGNIPKTGEGVNNGANGVASGSMISGSTSNKSGGTSEGPNRGEEKILDQQDVSDAVSALSGFDGLAFDGVYIQMAISDHEDAISLFEAAEKSEDPQIRSFASKNLPMLRRHLKAIKDIGIPSNRRPNNN
ncbi:putative membrane protein [Pedobacter sp. W3I1]|uniref:DUF4142 domain-containing protein n=1 Tax=Pedobacter sp. W3I1 TaxID=3042291 RepID=UPI00277F5BE6|nr:DUF4142 domain-containing protein [Pedobacter sp. W3I1]MDQ0638481.1 putative membrane protein [Pedobacter sp. W3I1]